MPNQNPAGANQPLIHHPKPNNGIYTVGQDAQITRLAAPDTDYLVVPPPAEGEVISVAPNAFVARLAGGDTNDADVSLVFKDGSGNEAVLDVVTLSQPDDEATVAFLNAYFYLQNQSQGLYARYTGGGAGVVSMLSRWDSVRSVQQQRLALSKTAQQVNPTPPAGTIFQQTLHGGLVPGPWLINTDDADHTVILELDDGSTAFEMLPQTVTAGESLLLQFLVGQAFAPGMVMRARLDAGDADPSTPVYLQIPFTPSNRGPVRQGQGGAY